MVTKCTKEEAKEKNGELPAPHWASSGEDMQDKVPKVSYAGMSSWWLRMSQLPVPVLCHLWKTFRETLTLQYHKPETPFDWC